MQDKNDLKVALLNIKQAICRSYSKQ